jgi:small subunit ribosomal protein S8
MLTRIRNATLAKKSNVNIPFTKLNQEIAQILEKEGFIQNFQISMETNDIVLRYTSKKLYIKENKRIMYYKSKTY